MSSFNSDKQAKARDLKHRVLTCLHKLSDRDTHSAAASELESIAKSLSADALPPFLSSISATDSSDKSPVRRHCVKLISVLSEHHKNSLSPYLSKLLYAVVRRLRDPDSAVRSGCVAASLSLSSNLTSPPFTSIAKPFIESLFSEQDQNAQAGAALCLAATIEGSRNPDAASLRRLLARLEKLAKCASFKAKAALLALIGSVVEVKGVLSSGVVRNLITCLMEFLSTEDWAARKAAAEALMKVAAVEKETLSEYKASCLKAFEAKRFDKVKAARETMNKMIEAWKQIPDLAEEEVSLPPVSGASFIENASDGRYPPGPKTSFSIGSTIPQVRKKNLPDSPSSRTPFADGSPSSTDTKISPIGSNGNKTGPSTAMFRKLDWKKPVGSKVETVAYDGSSSATISHNTPINGQGERKLFEKREIKRALFSENNEKPKLNLFNKVVSRVVPCGDDDSVVVSNETNGVFRNPRESDELSLIQKQLLQIEKQQSSLLDLLQRFIGSSQNGMHSLEARVHGLELALDDISFDLAVSTGRMSQNSPSRGVCCRLPGTEFFRSKLWKKATARSSASRLPAPGGTPSSIISDNIGAGEGFAVRNSRFLLQGGRGVIVNPLAKISSGSMGYSDVSSSGVGSNIRF